MVFRILDTRRDTLKKKEFGQVEVVKPKINNMM